MTFQKNQVDQPAPPDVVKLKNENAASVPSSWWYLFGANLSPPPAGHEGEHWGW